MRSDSADRPSFRTAAVRPATVEGAPAGTPALPGHSAAGNGDDLTTTSARNSMAIATDADDVSEPAHSVSRAFIYGFDSAGNPTLTDAG